MEVNIVTKDDLLEFKRILIEEIKEILLERPLTNTPRKWLKSNEVRRLLLISPGTLQNLRVNGSLPFTKIGGTLFYAYEDIQSMLEANKHDIHFLKKKRTATSFDDPVDAPKPIFKRKKV